MYSPKSICVFCGSRFGNSPRFEEDARSFGDVIGRNHWRLVYGAGDVGLMGSVADAAQAAGAEVFGVIPTHLMEREVGKRDISQLVITENMHERKKVMFMNSDAIVILPGGAGSLDEFFEVLTWRQLGLHDKPIILLNTDDYWAKLISVLDHVIGHGFADSSIRDYVVTASSPIEVEQVLKDHFEN